MRSWIGILQAVVIRLTELAFSQNETVQVFLSLLANIQYHCHILLQPNRRQTRILTFLRRRRLSRSLPAPIPGNFKGMVDCDRAAISRGRRNARGPRDATAYTMSSSDYRTANVYIRNNLMMKL